MNQRLAQQTGCGHQDFGVFAVAAASGRIVTCDQWSIA